MEKELNPIEIGERIKQKIKELNIKQIELANNTGISKNAISNYISGNRIPDTNSIFLISEFLKVSIEWLLIGKENPNELSNREIELIKQYRKLKEENKEWIEKFTQMKISEQLMEKDNTNENIS